MDARVCAPPVPVAHGIALPARLRRLEGLYRALMRAHRAMVRGGDRDELFAEVCAACVDNGHAVLASIWMLEGRALKMRTSVGPAARLLAEETPGWCIDAPSFRRSVSGSAFWGDRLEVCNDYLGDGRSAHWHARAAARGVRAMAAVPIRQGARVVGLLLLHVDSVGWFDGELVQLLDSLGEDLSFALDNLEREARRHQAERDLQDREHQLSGIVETAMDAIVTIGVDQRIRVFNQAAAAMFRIPAAEAIGQPLSRFIPAPARAAHVEHVGEFARTGSTSRRMGTLHTLSGLRADGEAFPIEASISKLGGGDAALMTAVIRDLSAVADAERARQAQIAAEAANRAKSEFISQISHELRTPLNAMLGFTQLLDTDPALRLDSRQRRHLAMAMASGRHLITLIDDLLDLARIEAGRLPMQPVDIGLGEVLAPALAMVEAQSREAGVALRPPPPAQAALCLHVDPARLRQVVINLVSNGIKYNRRGGQVALQARLDGDGVVLEVADDGIGMDAVQRGRLFEPFNRLGREASDAPGSGIGLALTRQLVTAMGGAITIDSEVGKGTRVAVRLPASHGPCGPAATGLPTRSAAEAAADDDDDRLQGLVLCVEDNPVNQMLVEAALARWPGVRLIQAGTVAEGLAMARTHRPSLVLLDMHLPDANGIDLLRSLRADPATRALPVVVFSADGRGGEVQEARDAGADDYWTKPLDLPRFERGLLHWLGRR